MQYSLEHIHLKAVDAEATANWYVKAFRFEIFSDRITGAGARSIECKTVDGVLIRISGPRPGDDMDSGNSGIHYGLEHFGLIVEDLESELIRLDNLRALTLDGPLDIGNGRKVAFIEAPDNVRIELMQISP